MDFKCGGLKRHFSKSRLLHPIFFSPFILVMNYFHLLALQWLCQQPNVCVVCCSKYCPNTPLKLMYYTVHCTVYSTENGRFSNQIIYVHSKSFSKNVHPIFSGAQEGGESINFYHWQTNKVFLSIDRRGTKKGELYIVGHVGL